MNKIPELVEAFLVCTLIASTLGSLGLYNGVIWAVGGAGHPRLRSLTHAGVWFANVALTAGIVHSSIQLGWLGFGQVVA